MVHLRGHAVTTEALRNEFLHGTAGQAVATYLHVMYVRCQPCAPGRANSGRIRRSRGRALLLVDDASNTVKTTLRHSFEFANAWSLHPTVSLPPSGVQSLFRVVTLFSVTLHSCRIDHRHKLWMLEKALAAGPYFDGDMAGASW